VTKFSKGDKDLAQFTPTFFGRCDSSQLPRFQI